MGTRAGGGAAGATDAAGAGAAAIPGSGARATGGGTDGVTGARPTPIIVRLRWTGGAGGGVLTGRMGGASAAAAGGGAAGGGAAAPAEEKTEFTATLTEIGPNKIPVIKVVRELTGLGLKEAKDLVDAAPKPVKEGIARDEAEKIKAQLEEQGAKVEIK